MKYSEMMINMACGDASKTDAYIQEAVGKINVANAIFALEYKISQLPEDEFMCVQEAVDAGMPSSKTEATAVSCEAITKQLEAFYDLINATAKKVKEAADKDMKLLIAFGKKNGVSAAGGDYMTSFVEPLTKKFDKIELDDKKFIKGKYALKLAENFGKGMGNFLSAYGLSIDNVFGDSIISQTVSGNYSGKKDVTTIKDIASNLSAGGKLIAFDKVTSKDSHYTSTVKNKDLWQYAVGLYAILNIAKAVVEVTSKNKKAAVAQMKTICDNNTLKQKKVTNSCETINDDIKTWTGNLTTVVDSITTAFGDSIYAINATN